MRLFRLKILLPFLCCALTVFSTNIRFRQFSTKQGFPTKDVNLSRQDAEGFMWFGTYDGLLRYDGTDFKQYIHDVNDSTTIPDNNISEIFLDQDGDLLIGGSDFLCRYNKDLENFTQVKTNLIRETFVTGIVQTAQGQLFVSTYKGLSLFHKQSNSLEELPIKVPIWDMHYHDGTLFLGTQYNGIILYSTDSMKVVGRINAETNPEFSKETSIVFAFDEDNNGNLWFSGNKGGLYSYSYETNNLEKHDVIIDGTPTNLNPFSIYADDEGRIWITFINNGVIIYEPASHTYEHITTEYPQKLSITSNSVRDIYQDKNGTVWLSTHFGGVCFYTTSDRSVEYYYKQNLNPRSLGHDIVSSFVQDTLGNLWIGTDGGGVYKYLSWDDFDKLGKQQGLNAEAVTAMVIDHDGDIWMSEWLGGVQEFSPQTQSFTRSFLHAPHTAINRGSEVKGLFCDSKNRIWMFPHYTSLIIYDQETNVEYSIDNPGEFPPAIFDLKYSISAEEDQDGNIWIASGVGLYRYSNHFSFEQYTNIPGDSTSFISSSGMNVFCDSKNRVWITTAEGLELFDRKTGTFIHVSQKSGFPTLFYGIIEDDRGYIWFSSPKGIGYFVPETMKIKFFDRNISVSGDDFINRAQYKLANGNLLFGSTNGYINVNPHELHFDTSRFPIVITELQLFNKPVNYKQEHSILHESILTTRKIILESQHSVFSLRFSALYFIAREQISYAYKLDGFDENWNNVGNEQKATYTNLSPGNYRFRVKAQNIEGVWSDEQQLLITILPPWWNTWWFRTLYISAVVFIFLGVYYNRINFQKRLNRQLTEKVKARTSELQLANADLGSKNEELLSQNETITQQRELLDELNKTKDKFFSIIAHDLKNPMHTLLGFTDLLLTRYDALPEMKKKQFIEAISRSSKNLFALMVNLLDWARSQSKAIVIQPENLHLNEIVHETYSLLSDKAEAKNIHVSLSISDDLKVFADRNMLETVIRNVISNALKFTPEKGFIEISATQNGLFVQLSIADSGLGIPEDRMATLFQVGENRSTEGTENEKGTGLGLILCKEFIVQNGGDIRAESIQGEGSTFIISIPQEDSYYNTASSGKNLE